ncbi:MAG: STM3941 family protein [Bdellovibrionia bacterium]
MKSESASTFGWLAAIVCAAGGGYILVMKPVNPVIGWGLLGLAALVPLPFLAGAHVQRRLVINDSGIEDSRFAMGVIPWNQIETATIENKYSNVFLCLKLKDPEMFLARMPPEKKKQILKNQALGFHSFNVGISGVDIDPLDLLELVRKKAKGPRI